MISKTRVDLRLILSFLFLLGPPPGYISATAMVDAQFSLTSLSLLIAAEMQVTFQLFCTILAKIKCSPTLGGCCDTM